jgi:hypothetical protein
MTQSPVEAETESPAPRAIPRVRHGMPSEKEGTALS